MVPLIPKFGAGVKKSDQTILLIHCIAEIKGFYPETDVYFDYFERTSASSLQSALSNLSTFFSLEGPYDAILGFSMGAGLAATYLIQCALQNPTAELPVKCAVFFSGQTAWDLNALKDGNVMPLDLGVSGSLITLPTANIWGRNDALHSGAAEALSKLCQEDTRHDYVHEEGHDIPSARAKSAVLGSVKTIRRTTEAYM